MQMFTDVSSKPFCVYGHYLLDRCVYVGSGYLKRAFTFDSDRGDEHRRVMKGSDISVCIFERYATEKEARDAERCFIIAMQPELNKHHYGIKTRTIRREITLANKAKRAERERKRRDAKHSRCRPIMCHQTLQYFYGPRHAGRKMNLCPARISAAVRGICRSVDGITFRYATWDETGLDVDLIGRPKAQDAAPEKFLHHS